MTEAITETVPEKVGGSLPIGKQKLYNEVSKHALKAIQRLSELLDSKQEAVAVSAAKTLLAKCIPDLRADEISGKDGEPLRVIIFDYGVKHQLTAKAEGSDQPS